MSLLRAAFECADGLVHVTVLCPGCFAEVVAKSGQAQHRYWSRPIATGTCEFCLSVIEESALR